MITYEELSEFVFDVLGDLVSPEDVEIEESTEGWRVIVLAHRAVSKETIFEDWIRNTKGTKFESVPVYA